MDSVGREDASKACEKGGYANHNSSGDGITCEDIRTPIGSVFSSKSEVPGSKNKIETDQMK